MDASDPDAVAPRPIGDGVDSVLRRLGGPSGRAAKGLFHDWEALVGPVVAAHAKPRSLRDGTLVVQVDEPAWASQLRFLGNDLLAKLRASAGPQTPIRQIHVQVAPHAFAKRPET